MSRPDIAAVVIGRNEGKRLGACLRAIGRDRTIYVDSGSRDGSADIARAAGVELIELDSAAAFTAGRARNAGLDHVLADPAVAYIQMVDGDCVLDSDWLATGAAALDADPGLGAVFGGLREIDPDASIYAWLCDVEWTVPPGPARVFGGLAMLRADAVRGLGGYRAGMIGGEDPDYAIRLRAAGWRIACLPQPMATHDAGITRFGQWWRRAVRGGHGFAELTALHPDSPLHDFARSRSRILFWGGAVPAVAIAGLLLARLVDPRWALLALGALLLVAGQAARVTLRGRARYGWRRATALAFFLAIGKYAEMIGLIRCHCAMPRRAGGTG